jgi:hypothetical protein
MRVLAQGPTEHEVPRSCDIRSVRARPQGRGWSGPKVGHVVAPSLDWLVVLVGKLHLLIGKIVKNQREEIYNSWDLNMILALN